MIEPYQAIGLVSTMWGIRRREEIAKNLEHIEHLFKAAFWLGGLDQPVRLVAIAEGALQGFTDEVMDLDHETYARECAIDIPGPETERIGALARKWDVFVMGQAKARHPEFPGRFFNIGFVISPAGEVILRHHKLVPLLPVEHSVTPHNVWDRWVELYGSGLDAFYPVVDTEIGRLGIMMANEGSYPENARGLAMNGAEVVYRASFPHRASDAFEVQTRARALDNNFYVIAPNLGTYYLTADSDTPIDTFGGGSLIVDHQGRVIGRLANSGGSSWVAGTVDIEALRRFRVNSKWGNWMKDLTTEQYRVIYEEPVYPKNLYLERSPYTHDSYYTEVLRPNIERLIERGTYARPGGSEPGIQREPAGVAGLGGVPVADGGLVDLPAEVDLATVPEGGEVDQAGLQVANE
jgi:predicted amidohydrolase